jgi:hypothetical protein
MIPSNQLYTVKNTQQLFFSLEIKVAEANLLLCKSISSHALDEENPMYVGLAQENGFGW